MRVVKNAARFAIQRWRQQSTSPRLDALRQQLQEEAQTEVIKVKGSKKNLPKPAWLKADVPSGENYENLRKTGEIIQYECLSLEFW